MTEDQNHGASEHSEWKVPAEEQLTTDAYHVWKPRPLLRSVHWKPMPPPAREASAGSYDVFIDQRVFRAIHGQMWNAGPAEEPLGFLVGDLCEDPDTGRRYVIISGAVPSRLPFSEREGEQIPGEALVAMQLEVDRRRGVLAGWYHRHLTGAVELTETDVRTHEKHFPEPWQVALLFVTDHARPRGGCFRRTHAGLAGDLPLPFFEMVSNESLLARGVRRSNLDWQDMETADAIERNLPPLPPLPEPASAPETESEPQTDLPIAEPPQMESASGPKPAVSKEGSSLPVAEQAPLAPSPETESDLPEPDGELPELAPGVLTDLGVDGDAAAEIASDSAGPEDILAHLEEVEDELVLPVLDVSPVVSGAPDARIADLPEPGWDSGDEGDGAILPLVEDVDLDSFVTEVESADIDSQVGDVADLRDAEPGWEEEDVADRAIEEPVVEAVTAPSEEDASDETGLEDIEPTEPVSEAQPEPEAEKKSRPARGSRRALTVAASVLVVGAVAVSLLMLVRPSAPDGGAGQEATPEAAVNPAVAASEEPGDPGAEAGAASRDVGSVAVADAVTPAASEAELKGLGDDLLASVSRFYGRAVAVDQGRAACSDLQTAYVEVEDGWIEYNVQGRARFSGRLPDELAARDERLYAGVQDVEREFARSGCERP